jgi:hypothetical protein
MRCLHGVLCLTQTFSVGPSQWLIMDPGVCELRSTWNISKILRQVQDVGVRSFKSGHDGQVERSPLVLP